MLYAWLEAAKDPALKVCIWLVDGAPAGVERDLNALDGIFERVEPTDRELDPSDLETDFDMFVNYKGVENDPDVKVAIDDFIAKGFLRPFNTLEDVAKFVKGKPSLTKL